MSARVFNLERGSVADAFDKSRAIVQVFGGGYGNGKTTAAVVLKVLKVARDYPGANIIVARSTYPKLNDTIRKEFYEWCPLAWIKRRHTKDDNTVYLANGTVINFRYVKQQGGTKGEETVSNLLSATYDLIVVDQIEDPEFSFKDFTDLMGRRRGQTAYVGTDPTMPRTGPRWLILTCNPTRNWVYTEIIRPLQESIRTGTKHDGLLVDDDGDPIIELFEGPTSINSANLPADYITGMRATMSETSYKRLVEGKWVGYEGLVYPDFDRELHSVHREHLVGYLNYLRRYGNVVEFREGYDYGLAEPSCYGLSFFDPQGNCFLIDGFYKKEYDVLDQAIEIMSIRMKYGYTPRPDQPVYADPSIFRRFMRTKLVGQTVAGMFIESGISMTRGNNAIVNGIVKLQGYIKPQEAHAHPIYHVGGAPRFFVANELEWFGDEIEDYYWKKTPSGEPLDEPVDRNNHAMDMIRYTFTHKPPILGVTGIHGPHLPMWKRWYPVNDRSRAPARHRATGRIG